MISSILSIVFFFSIILSWRAIRRGKGVIQFIYHWGFPLGVFVWEDLFVFSVYGFVAAAVTSILHQNRIGLLFYILFWVVRSAGETGYFFLQQFIQPKHHPHYIDDHFKLMRKIFGNITYQQCLILMQVMHQTIMMLSLASLIFLLMNWNSIG